MSWSPPPNSRFPVAARLGIPRLNLHGIAAWTVMVCPSSHSVITGGDVAEGCAHAGSACRARQARRRDLLPREPQHRSLIIPVRRFAKAADTLALVAAR